MIGQDYRRILESRDVQRRDRNERIIIKIMLYITGVAVVLGLLLAWG